MKLVTLRSTHPDGTLAVLSADSTRVAPVEDLYPNLQAALADWARAQGALRARAAALDAGTLAGARGYRPDETAAPLPRAYQWLDGSAFLSHGALMARVFNVEPASAERPLMYQGMSHAFLGATADVVLPDEADGIDFEGEFGVITDYVPMGVSVREAETHIRLIVQINDWSLRVIGPIEMKTGFGWVQGKPACSVAPVALSPDELGAAWRTSRVALPLWVWWNGALFGHPQGAAMHFGFAELIAHAARTRELCAGTIIGSGTVSNENYREVGSTCIAERRAIELLEDGKSRTHYMRFGDTVRMAATAADGATPFGIIEQRVVPSPHHPQDGPAARV